MVRRSRTACTPTAGVFQVSCRPGLKGLADAPHGGDVEGNSPSSIRPQPRLVGVEEGAGAVDDVAQDRAQVELAGQLLGDVAQGTGTGDLAPGAGDDPGMAQGHGGCARHGGHEAAAGFEECAIGFVRGHEEADRSWPMVRGRRMDPSGANSSVSPGQAMVGGGGVLCPACVSRTRRSSRTRYTATRAMASIVRSASTVTRQTAATLPASTVPWEILVRTAVSTSASVSGLPGPASTEPAGCPRWQLRPRPAAARRPPADIDGRRAD